jgi:1,4-dihydroxy-2-naphthoyl-CoA synthase
MMTLNMMSLDAKEGISAFLEKRSPKWKNKWVTMKLKRY